MTVMQSNYAKILQDNKILYLPSCVVVEMMTKLFSQVSQINLSGNLHDMVPDLLVLLRRMSHDLHITAEAYNQSRIKFFIGDWKDDKLRARKLFFNLMSRLGYISELLGAVEKALLYRAIEEMSREWSELDRIMEQKAGEKATRTGVKGETCRYFKSENPDSWRQVMAQAIMELDEDAGPQEDDTYLLLLCYRRVKVALLRVIETMEVRKGVKTRFSPDKILVVHTEDFPISCPNCALMAGELQQNQNVGPACEGYGDCGRKPTVVGRRVTTRNTALRGRYPMPPTLAGISPR